MLRLGMGGAGPGSVGGSSSVSSRIGGKPARPPDFSVQVDIFMCVCVSSKRNITKDLKGIDNGR